MNRVTPVRGSPQSPSGLPVPWACTPPSPHQVYRSLFRRGWPSRCLPPLRPLRPPLSPRLRSQCLPLLPFQMPPRQSWLSPRRQSQWPSESLAAGRSLCRKCSWTILSRWRIDSSNRVVSHTIAIIALRFYAFGSAVKPGEGNSSKIVKHWAIQGEARAIASIR